MKADATQLRAFLQVVHRRRLWCRAVETVALSLLVGCGFAVVFTVALWMQDRPALPIALASICIAAICGAAISTIRRASLAESTIELDRKLETRDLLCTALALSTRQVRVYGALDADIAAEIVRLAEARCRNVSASQIILPRVSARGLAGVALCVVSSLTLAALTSAPRTSIARSGDSVRARISGTHSVNEPAATGSTAPRTQSRGSQVEPTGDPTRTIDSPAAGAPSAMVGPGGPRDGDSTGGGTGSAKSDDARSTALTNSRAGNQPATGVPESGRGAPDRLAATGSNSSASARPGGTLRTPPWESRSWALDRATAIQSVESGAVPDAYRDLVRDYFSRD